MTASKLIAAIATAFPLAAFSATGPAATTPSGPDANAVPAPAAGQAAPAANQPRSHGPRSKADLQAYKEHGVKMSTCRDRATASGLRDEAFKTAVADCMR